MTFLSIIISCTLRKKANEIQSQSPGKPLLLVIQTIRKFFATLNLIIWVRNQYRFFTNYFFLFSVTDLLIILTVFTGDYLCSLKWCHQQMHLQFLYLSFPLLSNQPLPRKQELSCGCKKAIISHSEFFIKVIWATFIQSNFEIWNFFQKNTGEYLPVPSFAQLYFIDKSADCAYTGNIPLFAEINEQRTHHRF